MTKMDVDAKGGSAFSISYITSRPSVTAAIIDRIMVNDDAKLKFSFCLPTR